MISSFTWAENQPHILRRDKARYDPLRPKPLASSTVMPLQIGFLQRVFHLIQLERLNNCLDFSLCPSVFLTFLTHIMSASDEQELCHVSNKINARLCADSREFLVRPEGRFCLPKL
ncbi:MAG: hypothetical protein CM15mP21_2610 [Hyphomicrobiales bacterium]|nr:MAG: hypothetical protein CM15mP21_2610 [Hyphomicrobiales bacterium]